MGFFNAMSTIGEINSLLEDLENQITICQDQAARNAPVSDLTNSMNVLKRIHQDLINAFCNSAGARHAMFRLFGEKMQMDAILTYSKNIIINLNAIIQNRNY